MDVPNMRVPFVLQTALNDFFVTYQADTYSRNAAEMEATYGELHQNIQDSFNEAGVEIMSPHYAALRDGNVTAVPESYRSNEGESRSFPVRVQNGEEQTSKATEDREPAADSGDHA